MNDLIRFGLRLDLRVHLFTSSLFLFFRVWLLAARACVSAVCDSLFCSLFCVGC